MLKAAFNMLSRLHSRSASLKRLGKTPEPDLESPVRITPSNYFRFLEGPSNTVVKGREFILPLDTIRGNATQIISFSGVPTTGKFTLTYGANTSSQLTFSETAATIQTALRILAGLSNVTVSGNFTVGFTVVFVGTLEPLTITAAKVLGEELDRDITVSVGSPQAWSPVLKRGDRIVDSQYGALAIDEIMEIVDLGGSIMGYRCRCE